MSRFPRFLRQQLELRDRAKVERVVGETNVVPHREVAGATAAGDERRLRGIPAVSRGTSGAIPGTDPARAVLEMELRRRAG